MVVVESSKVDAFIAIWCDTGGSDLANTQPFVPDLCDILGVPSHDVSRDDDAANDYVFDY